MSRTVQVRVVCEGPTDTVVIRSALKALGVDAVVTQIQPESANNLLGAQGVYGGGWHGVRAWCLAIAQNPGLGGVLSLCDVLIVHVDADIAADPEVKCEHECPPCVTTCNCVRTVVLGWLGVQATSDKAVLCVPSMDMEAWVVTALHPSLKHIPDIECREKPASLLVGKKPKLVRKKSKSKYDKDELAYESVLDALTAGWGHIRRHCTQGARFYGELRTALP
jgi:hypothetical protein